MSVANEPCGGTTVTDNAEIIERNMRVAREFAAWMRERFGDIVLDARVFGSVARGDATEDSDVDVFLLLSRRFSFDEKMDIAGKTWDLLMDEDVFVQWVAETTERWSTPVIHGSGVARAVRREGVPV